ncbi:MAG: two-component system response regulator PfeR [Candidatus Azotimanducaceae bacterium]|jgi:two-component system response regulator PfeR
MPADKILIIEDDHILNDQLAVMLGNHGYEVDQCFDGDAGLTFATKQQHQLVLLDVMLPGIDGFSLLSILRENCQTPVIMLTAKGAEEERIKGFNYGADDYLAKPFNSTELLLRIEALLRRSHNQVPKDIRKLRLDGLYLNRYKSVVSANDKVLDLTPIQFKLLWVLLQNSGDVLSKPYLYQAVLNKTYGAHDRSLDMHLSRVRRKLLDADWPGQRLQTVHGKGYCLA